MNICFWKDMMALKLKTNLGMSHLSKGSFLKSMKLCKWSNRMTVKKTVAHNKSTLICLSSTYSKSQTQCIQKWRRLISWKSTRHYLCILNWRNKLIKWRVKTWMISRLKKKLSKLNKKVVKQLSDQWPENKFTKPKNRNTRALQWHFTTPNMNSSPPIDSWFQSSSQPL